MQSGLEASITSTAARIAEDARALQTPAPAAPTAGAGPQGFVDALRNVVEEVNAVDAAAGRQVAEVQAGRSDDLVGAMLASQQASVSFSMLMQVRNKVVGAMEDLIKLQL